jgi:ABC-type transport system involved in multi-copper enzyme maturation permease subunit
VTAVLLIARFTLMEAVSRRLVLAGVLISIGYLGLFALGFRLAYGFAVDNANPQQRLTLGIAFATLTLMGVYVVNYLASFLALFLSVGAVSGEIDAGTLHAVLARPLRRSEFLLGRWLGYGVILAAYILVMVGLVLLIARGISGYEVPDPLPALALMLLEGVLLLTVSLFGSTLLSTLANGVVVFTLLGLAWLAGVIEFIGRVLENETMLNVGTVVSLLLPSDALWRGASYSLQSPALLAVTGSARGGIPFFSSVPIATPLVVWAIGYVVVVLAAAMLSFARRDL